MDKPKEMKQKIYEQYISDGFNDLEIMKIWEDTLYFRKQMELREGNNQRNITSSTYEKAQNRLKADVENFLGFKQKGEN